jgi:hypothetical protein
MLGASSVIADGTETLGTPSITIGSGTGVVAGGTGMISQPGSISVDVPGSVVQVLLYWEGQMATGVPGDDTIVVDGNPVTGTLIGGQTPFFFGAYSSAFRADITGLGLVAPGANTLSVDGLAFTKVANGAGVLVIYDDGSTTTNIQVRDGVDLAFINFFSEPRKSTIPQAFNFTAASVDRMADLAMFFSSVSGSVSTHGFRPSSVEVTVDGTTTVFSNMLDSNDGEEWDTVNLDVLVPAGASLLTVQAFSRDDFGDGQDPLAASFAWTAAALSLVTPPSGEGCTPGFWKNHLELWPISPDDDFDATFGVDLFDPDITLGQAVRLGGGGVRKLARHGTAAYLNAVHAGVDYPLTVAEVIAAVQAGDAETLVGFNELGCEID